MKSPKLICIRAIGLAALSVSFVVAAQEPKAEPERSSATTRTVSGHEIVHYRNTAVPVDLSGGPIAALVPDGTGGYNQIAGSGTSAGTFSIPNVPTGFYLLQLGKGKYLWTSNTMVDADSYQNDRSTAVGASSGTTLTFDIADLKAWQDTDYFELVAPYACGFLSLTGTAGLAGETTFTGIFAYTSNLIDFTKGDHTYVTQLITQPVGGYNFTALGRHFTPRDFVLADGSNTTLTGRLKTINQSQTFRANINGGDLAAQALSLNPGATLILTKIYLDAYPGSLAKGPTFCLPDLVVYDLLPDPTKTLITTNADLGDVFYGNPFPATWPLLSGYFYIAQVTYLAPGATNAATWWDVLGEWTTALPTTTSPIVPLVGVVTSPMVGDANFFDNQTGIGLAPTLSWASPGVGTANFYQLQVNKVLNNAGNTEIVGVAALQTQSTSITIPPGLLSSGNAYIFSIGARYCAGVDMATTPFVCGPIGAYAYASSGIMQP